jgi:hypothetical protein
MPLEQTNNWRQSNYFTAPDSSDPAKLKNRYLLDNFR